MKQQKTKPEFNLFNERYFNGNELGYVYKEGDVKEFIRLLKEELNNSKQGKYIFGSEIIEIERLIDKLAGKLLVE